MQAKASEAILISIRAPGQGATGDEAPYIAVGYISIHAPAQGATGHLINSSRRGGYFNPRPRAGSDSNFS